MNWADIATSDPAQLLLMDEAFRQEFEPIKVDASVTIGMSAHGNIDTTLFALRALFASVTGTYQLILVDDASPDDTGALFGMVPLLHQNTLVFSFRTNIEYSGSLNTILSHATGDYVLFLSNDIFITPTYIQQLLLTAQQNEQFGIVRGCANFVDNGLATHSVKDCVDLDNFPSLFSFAETRAHLFAGDTIDDPFLTGDAFLVSRRVLDRIGFLDLRFYGYFVDHDFGVRARQAGFKPKLVLGAFAWHQHGANMDYLKAPAREEKMRARWARVNENWARFKEKYRLPVSMPYEGVRRIPWDGLAALPAGNKIPPCNNAQYCLPHPGTKKWQRYRAGVMADQARRMMQEARLQDAEALCHEALELVPEYAEALNVLGTVEVYQGRLSRGMRSFRKAIGIDPHHTKAHSNLLLSMNYCEDTSRQAIFKESKRWGVAHGGSVKPLQPMTRTRRSRIRIGYVSADFRRHSVGYFFLPLLENHDRSRFEIFCFSDVAAPDDMTSRMVSLSDGWRNLHGLDNAAAEAVIREAAPDILVDLSGHTGQVIRLPLFSRRLASVQITWLGYPNTTGLETVDYRLVDAVTDPVSSLADDFCTETLVRLRHGFLCYQPPADAPAISPPPAREAGAITFGCFNMLPKIQKSMIAAWCKVLHRTPHSRMILKNHFLRDPFTARRMRRAFMRYGIGGDRLVLLPSDPDTFSHLSQYGLVDIALDTFPYNGTTTTCEALYMGVPVVTMAGSSHASRVGDSLLTRLGLGDLVASHLDEYVAIAASLADNPKRLVTMRRVLRKQLLTSPLCDGDGFARSIEESLLEMWYLSAMP